MKRWTLSLIGAVLAAAPALGQEAGDSVTLRLGVGAGVTPEYFGAEDTTTGVTGSLSVEELKFGPFNSSGPKTGFGFGGSLRFVPERSADDYPELAGLATIDPSLELGGGLRFNQPDYELFANLRYGVIGHESVVAEMGGDFLFRPTEQLTLSAGPRLFWGSDDYAQTYFGVSAEESAASAFDVFDASGGILSQGVQAEASYEFNDDWGVTGTIRYDQLRDDAAASPITQSEDQISGSIMITRKVTFGF